MNYRSADLSRWISIFILILLTLGHAQPAPAQGQKGAISGIVTDDSGAYRVVIYLARHTDAVYVLHAFQKKTQATSKRDIDIARRRLTQVSRGGK